MNMLVTPLAVRFVSLSHDRVGEAINTQKLLFKKLNALAPSRSQKDKLTFGEWFTNTILLSEEDRQQRNTLFLRAQELLANNHGMVESLYEYVKEGGKEKPPLEVQEAMYLFWNGERQEAQEIAAQEILPQQEVEAQEQGPLSEQGLEAQKPLLEQTIEAQESLPDLANTKLAFKQKIKRPRFTPETMGLVTRVKEAKENAAAQANKPKSNVEKALTSPMFISTTSGVIGGLTGLTQHLITIGLLTSTAFLVSGMPIIAGIVGLALLLSFAYFSVRYNAKTEYARKLDTEFFSPFIESLDAMLSEILGNTRTILGLQNTTINLQREVKQDMRTGAAALNEVQATTAKTAATLQSTSEKVRNLQTTVEEVQEGFDTLHGEVQEGFGQVRSIRDDISRGIQSIKEEMINAPRQIINNYIVIDAGSLSLEQQRRLQGQTAARAIGHSALHPTITLSQEGQELAEILLDHPQQSRSQGVIIENHTRARKISGGSVASSSSSGSNSPTIGRSPTPESEDEGSSFAQGASSLFKGKGRAEPTILEEYNIDDLLSSDSESDSDGVLTPEQAAKAQKRAAKNAKIKALAERNAQLELENAKQKAAIQALIA